MNASMSLWRSAGTPRRYFLLPDDKVIESGEVQLHGPGGRRQNLADTALRPYELGEPAALRWAQVQLASTLGELREGMDQRLEEFRVTLAKEQRGAAGPATRVTPDSAPALLALLRKLPGVIATSLAGEPGQVASAKAEMQALQRRLKEAGIDLDERFSAFPDRLAGLRGEFDNARKRDKKPPEPH